VLRRWAPLAAALSVVAVAVAVSVAFGHISNGAPPRLRLAAGAAGDATAPAAATAAEGKRAASGSSFQLAGTLPSGPDSARAQSLPKGAASAAQVRRLAGALGVTAEPRRVEGAWQAGSLRIEDAAGQPWSFSGSCGPDVPVSSDGATVSCASGTGVVSSGSVSPGSGSPGSVSSGSGSSGSGTADSSSGSGSAPAGTTVGPAEPPVAAPAPAVSPCPDNARCAKPGWAPFPPPSPGPPVDVSAARHAASLVLADLGLSDADVSIEPAGEQAFVMADPRVAGLPTSGYATSLQIDGDGKVVGGNGYLGRPSAASSYPLISAKAAFDALPEPPRPMFACPSNADCPVFQPAVITGAELGLQLTALAEDEAALLPAWLFTVKDWPMPLAQPAIEPEFLVRPTVSPVPVQTAPDQPAPPAPGKPVPNQPARSAFGFDSAFPTDDPNGLIVQYGDSGSCPHTNVAPLAKESADSVVVFLEGDSQSPDRACTADYRQMLVSLTLQAPLGDRKVIDGSRGEAVAVDRTCNRPMGKPAAPKGCTG
jgi:hypothetical protein